MADKKEILSRATSSFKGLSTGDAVGKQTETLSREDILKWYPEGVKGFHGRIGDVIPRYIDGSYKWRIGETTDDTEQTMAVAKAIISKKVGFLTLPLATNYFVARNLIILLLHSGDLNSTMTQIMSALKEMVVERPCVLRL